MLRQMLLVRLGMHSEICPVVSGEHYSQQNNVNVLLWTFVYDNQSAFEQSSDLKITAALLRSYRSSWALSPPPSDAHIAPDRLCLTR